MANIAKEQDSTIRTSNYLSKGGQLKVGKKASAKLTESMLYKLCYYGFSGIKTNLNENPGYDRVRREEIDVHVNLLQYYNEVYTSKNWMVRVFKVMPVPLL
jgi:dolichyl-diphosphooligosaccharide--protein glycosyltransferase